MVRENLEAVQGIIEDACERAGRPGDGVTLIAVSKTKPLELVREAYEAGARDFGENKVQDLLDRIEALPSDIRWHMIGHLQRNKVKYIVGKVAMIHSVDSLRLAEEISRESLKRQVETDILIEVNVAGEESKFGFAPKEVLDAVREISLFPNIRVRGLCFAGGGNRETARRAHPGTDDHSPFCGRCRGESPNFP